MFQTTLELTRFLKAWNQGKIQGLNQAISLVYEELRTMAGQYLKNEKPGHTLQPTALIHEIYTRLITSQMQFQNRGQFFWFAGELMRRILVEHARAKQSQKRGRGKVENQWLDKLDIPERKGLDMATLLSLNEALSRLSELDPRQGQIVSMRFFAGLSLAEIAENLSCSATTIKREWSTAKRWLARELAMQRPNHERS